MKYCIIGAGAAGLAAARRFKEKNIDFDVLERGNEVGGIWNSARPESPVYQSTHLISSKKLTEYPDFPLPADYPDYPHHSQIPAYFQAFAKKFQLYPHIQFQSCVEKIEKVDSGWKVYQSEKGANLYSGVVVASGFTSQPNLPKFSGTFSGEMIHSKDYKEPSIFKGKRVLIVGAGNSGCDIATESAEHATKTFLSMRRGYYFIPKYLFGKPVDQIGELAIRAGLPVGVRKIANLLLLKATVGSPQKYGFPKPDHKIMESHPIVNSKILRDAAQGRIIPKPAIDGLQGDSVMFQDGSREEIDLILLATGYRPEISYIDSSHLNWNHDHAELYLHLFHPSDDGLFVLGMVQPDSGVWWLFDAQARAVAAFISAQKRAPEQAEKFRARKANLEEDRKLRLKYVPSLRHEFEVDHASYFKRLRQVERSLT